MSASAREETLGADRFVLKERIGGGAMGEVFRAHDRERGIDVALKVLRDPEPDKIYRFKREFRALADVAHPNLVRLHELVSWGDRWFFTMELVGGVDFLTWVRRGSAGGPAPGDDALDAGSSEASTGDTGEVPTPAAATQTSVPAASAPAPRPTEVDWPTITAEVNPTVRGLRNGEGKPRESKPRIAGVRATTPLIGDEQWARLRDALRQLAVGVQALHDRDTLHRDVKPSNVMVTPEGRVVLLDFGIITEVSRPSAADAAGRYFGTPAYMAPEVGTRRNIGEAADWYGIGVMMYEAMAGRRPFQVPVAADLLEVKRHHDAPPVREFAIAPPADLEALCSELLAREPDRRPTGPQVLSRLGVQVASEVPGVEDAPGDFPLVGRGAHLDALRAAFGTVLSGEPRVVLISGASGVGKSTLVSRFLAETAADGQAMVITGRCYERESVPFKAIDDLVDNLCQRLAMLPKPEVVGLLPRRVPSLARLFPVLEQIEAVRAAPHRGAEPSDPHEQRRIAFAALRELLVRLSSRRPLVLYIDDGQWGDDDSAALLGEVFRAPYAPPALLIINYRRTEEMGRFVDQVREVDREHVELEVGELDHDDARALADQLLCASGAPRRFASMVARESGGNPLFVTELVRYVLSGADADRSVSLEDIVRVRTAMLPAPARRLLQVLAVAAWPVPRALALSAAEIEGPDAVSVDALASQQLINVRAGRDSDVLETFHDRVRAAVVAGLSHEEVLAVHQRLAAVMDPSDARLVDHVAEHLDLAGDRLRAGACYRRAGDAAAAKLAFARAARMYARALDLLEPVGAERAELNARLADAYQNAGKGAESASAYMEAARDVDKLQALRYRGQAGQQLLRAGHITDGVATIEAVLGEVGIRMPAGRWRALLNLLWQRAKVRVGRLRFVERPADQVSPEQLTKIEACWTASVAIGMSDTMAGAVFQARHLLESLRAGEPNHVSHALAIETVYRSLAGMGSKGATDLIAGLSRDMANRTGDPLSIAWAAGAYSCTRYQFGEWRRSCDAAQLALTAMEGMAGMWFERATVEMYRLWSLFWMGHFRELTERTTSLRAQAVDLNDLYSATSLSIGLPSTQWLVRGHADECRRAAEEAMAGWSRTTYHLQHYWHAFALSQCDLYEGKGLPAWERQKRAWKDTGRALLHNLQMIRLEVLWARGRSAIAAASQEAGRRDELMRDAAWCARKLHRERRRDASALGAALDAGLCALRGDREGAVPLLRIAEDRGNEQEMYFLSAAAASARGRIIGGERGAALVRDAEAWMTEQTIADPAALSRVFLPGLESLAPVDGAILSPHPDEGDMKGNAQILDLLNTLLTGELTAVHQFIAHSRKCKNWGYQRLAEKVEHESHDELGHAGEYVERILFLGGTPDLQRLEPLRVGLNMESILDNDLLLEREAVARLNDGIALARSVGDNGTEALLTKILTAEEGHVLWLETQQKQISDIGIANYLSEQIKS